MDNNNNNIISAIVKRAAISFVVSLVILLILVSAYQFLAKNFESTSETLLKTKEYTLINGVKIFNSENEELNSIITKEIATLNKDLSNILGTIKLEAEINIVIFEDLDELQKYGELENIGAFYDNNFDLIGLLSPATLDREADVWFFRKDLRHEYTHYFLAKYLHENNISDVPTWFNEGLAEYIGITMDDVIADDPKNEVIAFDLLKTREDWAHQRRKHDELYAQAHYGIKYIVNNNDLTTIKKIIDDSYELGFSKSFKKHTNIEINQLHKLIS
ncbi:collagenase [Peribacillus muralis]|uniref:collagenase n=1 Tax=Peribacillus muralis TaxID=264697 RepID=UPI003D084BBA